MVKAHLIELIASRTDLAIHKIGLLGRNLVWSLTLKFYNFPDADDE